LVLKIPLLTVNFAQQQHSSNVNLQSFTAMCHIGQKDDSVPGEILRKTLQDNGAEALNVLVRVLC